MRELLG